MFHVVNIWHDTGLFFRGLLVHPGLMRLSCTRSPFFLVSTTQWLPMVCNKKRVIIVALTFASVWICMNFDYFTIRRFRYETDDSDMNETLHQLIDFKGLGRNKRAVLLLIIVSTARARFERRQAIRETWWKHCSDGNQAQVGRQDRLFIIITSYLTMTLFSVIDSEIFYRRRRCRRCDDDGNKQISTALD